MNTPTDEVASRMPLTADQQARLLLTLAIDSFSTVVNTPPVVGQLVFILTVPRDTPAIERVGELVGHWSYVPTQDEVWMIGLLDGSYLKWSNVTVLPLPAQLDDNER